ncbi:MAG: cell division protein FtsZ [Candidatus Hydrogenedentes bacterium]|nr:cell division protein FtsZ [Candidatus Hydrogenedentota bacterium]
MMSQDLFEHGDQFQPTRSGEKVSQNPRTESRSVPGGAGKHFETFDQRAVVKVCGIGGGGSNAVDRMIKDNLTGVDYIVINTDAQALRKSRAPYAIQIGKNTCGGLGAGADPEVGRKACEEDIEQVRTALEGAHLVMLAVGLGGGTGTGAAPLVAKTAREIGALTIAFVTLPFPFEGEQRMENALQGLELLKEHVDTLVVVLNERILEISTKETSFLDAFRRGDDILYDGVRAITELITVPGLINVDFADLRSIMKVGGRALMGIGTGEKEDRAVAAARMAIECPLLDQSDIVGAKGVIINVRGGSDMRMLEVEEAINFVKKNASPDARIIFGAVVEDQPRADFQVTVIAAGFPERDYREHYARQSAMGRGVLAGRGGVGPETPPKNLEGSVMADSTPAAARSAGSADSRPPDSRQPVMPGLPGEAPGAAASRQTSQVVRQAPAAPVTPVARPKAATGDRQPIMPAAKVEKLPDRSVPKQPSLDDQPMIFTDVYSSDRTKEKEESEEKKRLLNIPAFLRRSMKK